MHNDFRMMMLFLLVSFMSLLTPGQQQQQQQQTCERQSCQPVTCLTLNMCMRPDDWASLLQSLQTPDWVLARRSSAERKVQRERARGAFNGTVLRIGVVNNTRGHPQLDLDPVTGLVRFVPSSPMGLIVESLAKRIGARYRILISDKQGRRVNETDESDNSTFDGLIGMVQRGEIDIAADRFNVLAERTGVVDFSRFVGEDTYTILMRSPSHFSKADSLIAPFSREVWLTILASCLLMGPLLYLFVNRLQPMVFGAGEEERDEVEEATSARERLTMERCYWFVYGALMKQGFENEPRRDCTRILLASWWLFIQVITSFYTAELTAVLTLSSNELPVKDLDDIRNLGRAAKWVAVDGAEMRLIRENKLYSFLDDDIQTGKGTLVHSVQAALNLVLTEDSTYFLAERSVAEREVFADFRSQYLESPALSNKQGCRLSYVPDDLEFATLPYALVARKGEPALMTELNKV